MKIFDVLARLKNVKGPDASGNYLACCPAHDDKRQSLSVKQGERGVIMKCYAACGRSARRSASGWRICLTTSRSRRRPRLSSGGL